MSAQTRLMPFRDYDDRGEVINLFSLDAASGDAGALVKIAAGNLSDDPVEMVTRNTANGGWRTPQGHASSYYPEVPLKVSVATNTGENILGIMLRDVRETDENGEKLLFYPQKKEELQCVVSGEAVPILRRGQVMVNYRAFRNGVVPNVGDLAVPSANGTVTGVSPTAASTDQKAFAVGRFIGTGNRVSQQDADVLAGAYALLLLEL